MKGLIVRTDGTREVIDFTEGDLLSKVQKVVDGWVDIVRVISPTVGELSIWVNDEGLLLDLPVNPFASALTNENPHGGLDIVGDVVVTGGSDSAGNTMGLDDEQEQLLLNALVVNRTTGELV